MLTKEQRAELEALGPETVRAKLGQHGTGRGALIYGFKTGVEGGGLTRGDVEDWQVEKYVQEATMQKSTARWAQIAAWAGIAGAPVGLITVVVTIWLAK